MPIWSTVKSPDYFGDLEQPKAFESALAARCATPVPGGRRECLLFVLDTRHAQWAQNLLLNLDEHGLSGRALAIGSSDEACAGILARVSPSTLACGHSTFMRRVEGSNRTLAAALKRWRIREWHVYHLWWQRWHYLARAVSLGYNALSLDTDISLRANPYNLFHGALRHRQLIVGLDSEASGAERPGLFPMINVGLVYCQRCHPRGPAHTVLTEVTRRASDFLHGPLLWKTLHRHTNIAERVLWEQDLFKDAIEYVAFQLPPNESRHARMNANPPEAGFPRSWMVEARQRTWRTEPLPMAPNLPPQPCPWLPLPAVPSSSPSSSPSPSASSSESSSSAAADESVAGLPLWIFSPWNVPPHGAACAGQWAARPPPVMIGHLVGCTSKHLMMRQLGWWHYEVSAADALITDATARAGGLLALAPGAVAPRAVAAAQAAQAAQKARASSARGGSGNGSGNTVTQPRAFPDDARVLVLRRHALQMRMPKDVGPMWDVIRRFCLLALALGRRAVVPLVPCELSPCAPRVPNPLRPSLYTISLGEPRACAEGEVVGSAADLTPRPVGAPLGWKPSPDASDWWSSAQALKPHPGCCQPIPNYPPCIDPAGARRPLGAEPLISTADLARFLEEAPPSLTRADGDAGAGVQATQHVAIARLSTNWTDDTFEAMREQAAARVLVVDAGGLPSLRLPEVQWLASHGGGTAAEEAIGVHAARCFTALARG